MNDTAHDTEVNAVLRAGGVAGLIAMALMLAGLPLAPQWPGADAPPAAVIAYFTEHRAGFLRQAYVEGLGVVFLLGWAGALAHALRARGEVVAASSAFGAMALFTAGFGLNWTPWIVLAARPARDPAVAQALYDFGLWGQFTGVAFPLTLLFGALTVGVFRTGALPRWLAALGAVEVAINLGLGASTATHGVMMPNGPFGMGSIMLFTVWVLAASVVMVRRGGGNVAAGVATLSARPA